MATRVLQSGGVYFNGYNAYGEINDSPELNPTNEISLIAFVKFHVPAEYMKDRYAAVFDKYNTSATPFKGYYIEYCPVYPNGRFAVRDSGGTYYSVEYGGFEHNKVYMIAGIVGDTMQAWKNLNKVGETARPPDISVSPKNLIIGRGMHVTVYSAMVYKKAISYNELEQIYYNPHNPPKDGLVLWLPFTENQGVIARDYSGNNNHCRLYNARWVNKIRKGMYFDNGSIKFDVGLNVNLNYVSTVAVFSIFTLNKGGVAGTGRNAVLRLGGDQLMLWNDYYEKRFRTTNYDGVWKAVPSNIDLEAGQVYTAAGICNGNELHLYLASNGEIIDYNFRTDIGDAGTLTNQVVYLGGSVTTGKYDLHGIVYAGFVYNRPITEDEIKQISLYWYDEERIPKDGLMFGCILDRNKYGDTPYDFVNGVYATYVGTPRWVVRSKRR